MPKRHAKTQSFRRPLDELDDCKKKTKLDVCGNFAHIQ